MWRFNSKNRFQLQWNLKSVSVLVCVLILVLTSRWWRTPSSHLRLTPLSSQSRRTTAARLESELRRRQAQISLDCVRVPTPWPGYDNCTAVAAMMAEFASSPDLRWSNGEPRVCGDAIATCAKAKKKTVIGPWTLWGNDQLDLLAYTLLFPSTHANRLVVEFGASDGVAASNSLFFEQVLGWRSLLIEPTRCFEQLRAHRPKAIHVRAAVCEEGPPRTVSLPTSSTWCSKSNFNFNSSERDLGGPYIVESGRLRMTCRTLTSILAEHHITHVDLMFVDMEGFEIDALRGIDFEHIMIDYFVVEKRTRDVQEKVDFMREMGYGYMEIGRRDGLFFRLS